MTYCGKELLSMFQLEDHFFWKLHSNLRDIIVLYYSNFNPPKETVNLAIYYSIKFQDILLSTSSISSEIEATITILGK